MTQITDTSTLALPACEAGFDPIEDRLRANIRGTIEAVFNEELNGFLGRLRYGRNILTGVMVCLRLCRGRLCPIFRRAAWRIMFQAKLSTAPRPVPLGRHRPFAVEVG